MLFSLFDKIGFFINEYFKLGLKQSQVNFKSLWFNGREQKKGIRPEFKASNNWPLQGLYWLSKDLHEKDADAIDVIEPAARELDAVRNHIEHKYFKLQMDGFSAIRGEDDMFFDSLCFAMGRDEFKNKALRLMKVVRAALIYLSLAVHASEVQNEVDGEFVMPIDLRVIDDSWKH